MHDVKAEGPIQRYGLGWLGIVAALALLAVSVAMNYRFGFSLGKSSLDGHIYGVASAAADCFKALVPFFFFAALRNRMWSQALAAASVWAIVAAYSMTSALGHAALNRSDTTGHRATESADYKSLQGDKKRAEEQLGWIAAHRPAAQVRAEIEGLKAQRMWTASSECSDPTGKTAREYCQGYHRLNAELGAAVKGDALEARIAEIEGKLANKSGGAANSDADPQASVLAKITGLDVEKVQSALAIFVALLIEVGSGFGLYVATGFLRKGRHAIIDLEPEETEPRVPLWDRVKTRLGRTRGLLAPASSPPALSGLPTSLVALSAASPGPASDAVGFQAIQGQGGGTGVETPLQGGVEACPADHPNAEPLNTPPARAVQPIEQTDEEAAEGFFWWCRRTGRTGQYFTAQLDAAYDLYCQAENCTPIDLDKFREAMGHLHHKQVKKQRVKVGKQRLTCWTITQGRSRPANVNTLPDVNVHIAEALPATDIETDPAPEVMPPQPVARRGGLGSILPFVASAPNRAQPAWRALDVPAFARMDKAQWQQMSGRSRKQRGSRTHRMARAA